VGHPSLSSSKSNKTLAPFVGRGKLIPTILMEKTTINHHAQAMEEQVEDTTTSSNQRTVRHLSYNELTIPPQNQQFSQNQLQLDSEME